MTMQLDDATAAALPATLKPELEIWLAGLREALGPEFVSLVIYGGLARGEFDPDHSDINLMAVVREASPALLDRISATVSAGVRDFRAGVFLITELELQQSTDVFPVKFLDIQRNHRLLAGRDVLSALTISHGHLRLRCEQELRDLVLNLRRIYIRQSQFPEVLETWLTRSVSSLLVNLAVLREMRTGQPAPNRDALLGWAGTEGVNPEPIREAMALRRGTLEPNAVELRRVFGRFLQTLETAAALADKTEEHT